MFLHPSPGLGDFFLPRPVLARISMLNSEFAYSTEVDKKGDFLCKSMPPCFHILLQCHGMSVVGTKTVCKAVQDCMIYHVKQNQNLAIAR